jgi:hypothetical protein
MLFIWIRQIQSSIKIDLKWPRTNISCKIDLKPVKYNHRKKLNKKHSKPLNYILFILIPQIQSSFITDLKWLNINKTIIID